MILKCQKCGCLYQADDLSQETTCSCSVEKTVLTPASEQETALIINNEQETQGQETIGQETTGRMYSLASVRTTSVLSSLGLHSDCPRVHTEASPEKYEYLQALGSGGMAEVVRAWDRDLHRFVAIKRMRPELDSKDDVLRFVKEAQVTGKLEHPGIVPVHDLGIDSQGRLCFSLKLIEGESLKSIIAKRTSVQEISVGVRYKDVYTTLRMIEIFISVCQAVAYAHSKGVIHRDLKPDNIMLGRYGEALVVDWGIAKVLA